MNYLRDLTFGRLRAGESERRIARDLRISRITVHRYHELAERQGFLKPDSSMPEDGAISAALGEAPQPPQTASTVEAYAKIVEQLLDQQVEMVAIFQRLRDDHGYHGSYSSVRR
jgi:DNA-binding transcriptional regulator LsrR (DeoR family)